MNALAAIHVARKQLGLDEDTYRAVALRVTGKDSARDMSEGERGLLLEEMRRQGFKPANRSTGSRSLQGPFAKKLQAHWIALWNLGEVADRRDTALLAFVKRQTNIDHTRFLLDGVEAAKAIEALKAWAARAGVDWRERGGWPAWRRQPGAKVALAQWQALDRAGRVEGTPAAFLTFVQEHAFRPIDKMTAKEWQGVMNRLGEMVRQVRKAAR
jgi:phage gp16-like protein